MITASKLLKNSAFQLFCFSAFTFIGLAAWALAGRALVSRADLDIPLNVLGINRSPYGEVIALAMQGPIDQTFEGGLYGRIGTRAKPINSPKPKCTPGKRRTFTTASLLSSLDEASQTNTNPRRASDAHRFYLRRKAEDKLRFAYHLDPSQYSNYNALHFFLTEPSVGTRPELSPAAAALAKETIDYCLKQDDDPRPALTAAAACTNILHLMFTDRQTGSMKYSTDEMREVLSTLDHSIARYEEISGQWETSGNWKLLSPQRIEEGLERYEFILKIRNAAEIAIDHFSSSQTHPSQSK